MKAARAHDQVATFLDGKRVQAGVYHREELPAGTELRVPCIVTEYSSTTLIPAAAQACVDAFGNLLIEL